MKTIQEIIDGENYNFLRTDEHLRGKLIFLTLGDSHAYGTNIPSSDINVRGCAFNRKSDLIGLSSFEQVINEETNTTIYSFNELVNLLCNCNPNVIEMLGCKPEHYLMLNPVGQDLINNRKMFLSKKAVQSFGGYANQQLRQLQDALAYNSYPQSERERHIIGSIKSAMADFDNRYASIPEGSLSLEIGKSERPDLDNEIFVNVNLMHYPLMDYKNIWSDMHNIVKYHGKLNKRNSKKMICT